MLHILLDLTWVLNIARINHTNFLASGFDMNAYCTILYIILEWSSLQMYSKLEAHQVIMISIQDSKTPWQGSSSPPGHGP
jgi:hypothetical protein